jgi:hypothetical protein
MDSDFDLWHTHFARILYRTSVEGRWKKVGLERVD